MTTGRPAHPAAVAAIREVHVAAIRGLAATHYDVDQIDAWGDLAAADYSIPAEGAHVVVAEAPVEGQEPADADGAVVGFGALDLESGEVRAVYVHPDHGREGVGGTLLAELERAARAAGLTELHLTASLNAVAFYEAQGWTSTAPTTHELDDGTELEARTMRKSLDDH